VIDLVYFHVERKGDIVPYHLEPRVGQKVRNIVFGGGVVVVDTEDVVSVIE
jgi:hypothetical protein